MKPLGPAEPRRVGQYGMLAELGRGGMGRVLLGCAPDGLLVALKQIRAQFVEDEGFRARFRREVDLSRKVSGAYTAAVVDADPDAAVPWLASVFVLGPSLREAVDAAGPLPEESVLRLAAGLAAALAEVHREGLVHRDLKPSNVLLAADGPRVIDFGIARATDVDGGSELTHTGWLIGSPGFMSPEQADGRPVSSASDIFSLGSVLAMACTGKALFAGPSTPQTLYNVVHTEPELSAVPKRLRRIIKRCLAKAPAARPTPAQLLDLTGPLVPSARPWPAPVHRLIDEQRAEVETLLDTAPEPTTHIAGDAMTLARTRLLLGPPDLDDRPPQDERPGGLEPPTGVLGPPSVLGPPPGADTPVVIPAPPARPPQATRVLTFAGIVGLISLLIWAPWSSRNSTRGSPSASPTTSTTNAAAVPRLPSPTADSPRRDTTENVATSRYTAPPTTKPDDGPFTARTGDCFSDSNISGTSSDYHRFACGTGRFKVLKRVDGSSDSQGQCRDVAGANQLVSWNPSGSRPAMVLCLQYLYANTVFNGQAGNCARGNADGSNWQLVACGDREFQIHRIFHGTSDKNRCGDDVRVRYWLSHTEARSTLAAVVCLTFRYGDDGAFGRVNNCMQVRGSGTNFTLVFADCARANAYVSGYQPSRFDPNFCRNDGRSGWNDPGPFGRFLNYTVCWRHK